jgi:predicted O-methyltransferase YrrM
MNTLLETPSTEYYSPVLLSPAAIIRRASRPETLRVALDLMSRLEPDSYVRFLTDYYETGLRRFGEDWMYADIVTVLIAAAAFCKPSTYLEIGVRRGRSLAAVVRQAPDVSVFAFDMWMPNYARMPNPGPEFVRSEMERIGYYKPITFVDGNSHETLPRFFSEHADLRFDLITVDGDHSEEGALQDLRDVLPYLAVGGVIVFDDVSHPLHPYMLNVWHESIRQDGGIKAAEFADLGYGVAVGIRDRLPQPANHDRDSNGTHLLNRFVSSVRRRLRMS